MFNEEEIQKFISKLFISFAENYNIIKGKLNYSFLKNLKAFIIV